MHCDVYTGMGTSLSTNKCTIIDTVASITVPHLNDRIPTGQKRHISSSVELMI